KVGQPVCRVRRLRLADAEPLAIEDVCVSFIGCERLLETDLEHDSLYRILTETFDMPPVTAEQEIEADLAEAEDAKLLDIAPGDPVLRTRRVTSTRRGQPIEYAQSVYRGDKYRFYTRLAREFR
ncbi:MAG: UTRA domain-containing protein, partial [Thermomicrobiales bacterium]|nr:UTRA domain-containing protein [Thermomicrobiales bacterium]